MFNPFEIFRESLTDAFLQAGKRYLVSQTFRAAAGEAMAEGKETILLTHYDELARAQIHFSAVKTDRYAAIIDLCNQKHLEKIRQMLDPGSRYLVYSSLISSRAGVERSLNARLGPNMRRFINRNTKWKIGADETIRPQVDLAFGELYIILKYRNQQVRFKLAELELV
jgi:hypothetical protein